MHAVCAQDEGDFVIYNNDAIVWSTNASAAHRAWAEKVSDDDLVQTKATNHDYFVAHKAFFFDLSVWDDEARFWLSFAACRWNLMCRCLC